MRTLLPVWFPMLVARFEKSVVSSGVNTRRKARRPSAFSAWVKQAVSVVALGMHDRIEVARAASANAYPVALPTIVAYWPTPAGEIETEDPPTVAKPPISVSASTGARGTPPPSKSRTLFANSPAVSLWSDAVETGAEGSARPYWLHHVCAEVFHAMDAGASIQGVCIYPILDYLGWDNDRSCEVGLLSAADEGGKRSVYTPLLQELRRQEAHFVEACQPHEPVAAYR